MSAEYECVMVHPPKLKTLHRRIVTLTYQDYRVDGFSRGGAGRDAPNGISFNVRKIVNVKHRRVAS